MTAYIDHISVHAEMPSKGKHPKRYYAYVTVEDNLERGHQLRSKTDDHASLRDAWQSAVSQGEALCRRLDRASANERAFQDRQDQDPEQETT